MTIKQELYIKWNKYFHSIVIFERRKTNEAGTMLAQFSPFPENSTEHENLAELQIKRSEFEGLEEMEFSGQSIKKEEPTQTKLQKST